MEDTAADANAARDSALDGSGLDRDMLLSSLSADERKVFCEWAKGVLGGYGTKIADCGDHTEGIFLNEADCLDLVDRGCKVGVMEDCMRDWNALPLEEVCGVRPADVPHCTCPAL